MVGRKLTRRQLVGRGAIGALVLSGVSLALPRGTGTRGDRPRAIANLIANPRARGSLDGWSPAAAEGAAALRRVDDGVELAGRSTSTAITVGADRSVPCSAGHVVWLQADARAVASAAGSSLVLAVGFHDGGRSLGGTQLQAQDQVEPGRWYTLAGFSVVPAGATSCELTVTLVSPRPAPVLRVTRAMVVDAPATMPDYFDGDSLNCGWTGRPNASVSVGPPPVPARPARRGFLAGWNDNSVTQSGVSVARDVALNREIGMTVLRCGVDIRGAAWQSARGAGIDWSIRPGPAQIAELSDACHAAGIKFLPALLGAPDWMSSAPGQIAPPRAANYRDWASLGAQIAKRLAPNLAGVEVWNEPNLVDFWAPGADAGAYSDLLVAAAPALRAAAPGVPVLTGGLSGVPQTGQGNIALGEFLGTVYARAGAGAFDGVAFHPYPEEPDTRRFDFALRSVRDTMATAGHAVPLWVTEIGISTTGGADAVSEDQQASIERLLYAMLKRQGDVQVVCWHTSVPPSGTAAGDREFGYAFVEPSGRRKPVFGAVRAELAGERS